MDMLDIECLTALALHAEMIANSYDVLTASLEAELLERVRGMPPAFFEAMIIDVLLRLGYGGGRPNMGQAIGRVGDGGIDGIIKEDCLGLNIIYVQAKRYAEGRTVGRPEVQMFAGSLDGVSASKGIFITTGSFSAAARNYVKNLPKRIVLIGGSQLARLMVDHEIGVSICQTYKIKQIDAGYFNDTKPPAAASIVEVAPASRETIDTEPVSGASADDRADIDPPSGLAARSRRPAPPRIAPPAHSAKRRAIDAASLKWGLPRRRQFGC